MVQIRNTSGKVISLEIAKLTALDRQWIDTKLAAIRELNTNRRISLPTTKLTSTSVSKKSNPADSFEPFVKKGEVKFRQDDQYFYVESNSMPDHKMMVGITAWQQQVPIPQPYFGNNAWRIPLEPVVAKNPLSAKSHFFRGAIALAANGIPIFNPIKNDGRTDTLIAGELDEFGGHCGRADDYHYHIAPTHLQDIVGKDKRLPSRSMAIPFMVIWNQTDQPFRASIPSMAIQHPNSVTTTTRLKATRISTEAFMAK